MPPSKSSLITLQNLSKQNINTLFSKASQLKKDFGTNFAHKHYSNSSFVGTAALLFFEPSTRTRFSFEAACVRSGFHPLVLDGGVGTSLEKGETIEDTILNIQAMRPHFFVIRCSDQVDLSKLQDQLSVPILNAGWGKQGHPTQALLDAYTVFEHFSDLKDKKILFVGDLKHSRVVASHLELSRILGYSVGFCAPADLLRQDTAQTQVSYFDQLSDGLQWADAVMTLRVQKERHDSDNLFLLEDYVENYGLSEIKLRKLKPNALIMHPGPVNYGIEVGKDIHLDKRCVILKQVENGVFMREALIRYLIRSEE